MRTDTLRYAVVEDSVSHEPFGFDVCILSPLSATIGFVSVEYGSEEQAWVHQRPPG